MKIGDFDPFDFSKNPSIRGRKIEVFRTDKDVFEEFKTEYNQLLIEKENYMNAIFRHLESEFDAYLKILIFKYKSMILEQKQFDGVCMNIKNKNFRACTYMLTELFANEIDHHIISIKEFMDKDSEFMKEKVYNEKIKDLKSAYYFRLGDLVENYIPVRFDTTQVIIESSLSELKKKYYKELNDYIIETY